MTGNDHPTNSEASAAAIESLRSLLKLTLTPGIGPVLCERLLRHFGTAEAVAAASPAELQRVEKIGPRTANTIARGLRESERLADEEIALATELCVGYFPRGSEAYPKMLEDIPSPPPLLSALGSFDPNGADRYAVAIVGSRRCSAYGMEQAERFAGVLASAGVTIVSGGARGIDTAAHRAALRLGGRTIAVLGCGLAECYPPENRDLFAKITGSGRGAVVSELPLRTKPAAENFPARNRIISGLCLGVLVIEASERSGALITARLASEEHGREVMALPGRVDNPASAGVHRLLKAGGAHLVTEPRDVLELIEQPARHLHAGTHAPLYTQPAALFDARGEQDEDGRRTTRVDPAVAAPGDEPTARAILAALDGPLTLDEIAGVTRLGIPELRAAMTALEIRGRVRRRAGRFERVASGF